MNRFRVLVRATQAAGIWSSLNHHVRRISIVPFMGIGVLLGLLVSSPAEAGVLKDWRVGRDCYCITIDGERLRNKVDACTSWQDAMRLSISSDQGWVYNQGATTGWIFQNEVNDGVDCRFDVTLFHCAAMDQVGCRVWEGPRTDTHTGRFWEMSHKIIDVYAPRPDSCVGNPIYPLAGTKQQVVSLDGIPVGFSVDLTFDSARAFEAITLAGRAGELIPIMGDLGRYWYSSVHKRLILDKQYRADVLAMRGNGTPVAFEGQGTYFFGRDDHQDKLTGSANFPPVWYRYYDKRRGLLEVYDGNGVLKDVFGADGTKYSYIYSDASTPVEAAPGPGYLISVVDRFWRHIDFTYKTLSDGSVAISTLSHDAGIVANIEYAGSNLQSVSWANGDTRSYTYTSPNSGQAWALSGIVGEDSIPFAKFAYSPSGGAISTEHSGGVGRYSVEYTTPPGPYIREVVTDDLIVRYHEWSVPQGVFVSEPSGQLSGLTAIDVMGSARLLRRDQPAGSGCDASSNRLSYDGHGNVTSRVDFDGRRSCHAYDPGRNLETVRVEGLADTPSDDATCNGDIAGYQVPGNLPAEAPQRKITTVWHPLWNLEARRAEPRLITTTVYNGQPDPLNNNAVTSCAASAPPLPDGSLIAVVCKRYEHSTNDETGNLGFTAPVVDKRSWTYTYNQYGQVLTVTDPRDKVTTSEYWSDTSFPDGVKGHTLGDLKSVMNPLGQKTHYTEYSKRGQALTIQMPNGSLEKREYHARGWLTKVTQTLADGSAAQVTRLDYLPTGLLYKVTQADGSHASYSYDAAYRLTDVTDSAGNSVHYELDSAGNRTAERFKDTNGALSKSITRSFDALGRMKSSTGAP